jgi:hypothetical protein
VAGVSGADELADFYVHTASVRTYLGMTGNGRKLEPAVDVPCFARAGNKQVTKASGDVVVSTTTLTCDPSYVGMFPVESQVSVNGTDGTVVQLGVATSGALDLPDHLTVYLN